MNNILIKLALALDWELTSYMIDDERTWFHAGSGRVLKEKDLIKELKEQIDTVIEAFKEIE